jgi:hypothetical protein
LAQDRLICLISPFFEKRASLTHHEARYPRMAGLYKLGWMPHVDPGCDADLAIRSTRTA